MSVFAEFHTEDSDGKVYATNLRLASIEVVEKRGNRTFLALTSERYYYVSEPVEVVLRWCEGNAE